MPITATRRHPTGLRLDPATLDVVIGARPGWSTCPGCGHNIPPTPSGQAVIELETTDGAPVCHSCARHNAPGLHYAASLAHYVLATRRRGQHDQARAALLALDDALSLIDEHEADTHAQHATV